MIFIHLFDNKIANQWAGNSYKAISE